MSVYAGIYTTAHTTCRALQDFIDALTSAAKADAVKKSSQVTGKVDFVRPGGAGTGAAAAIAVTAIPGFTRAPGSTAGVSVAGLVAAQAKATADSKQKDRKRWDSKAGRK